MKFSFDLESIVTLVTCLVTARLVLFFLFFLVALLLFIPSLACDKANLKPLARITLVFAMLTVDENKTSKKNDQPISRCFAEPSSLPKDKHHHHSRKTYGTINQDEAQPSDSIRTKAQTEYLNETTPIDPAVYRGVIHAMPALAIGIFLASADQTIVVSSYGRIGSELRALNQTSWIATSYASPSGY